MPNQTRSKKRRYIQTQKAKITSLKTTQKSTFFGGRNQTPPDEIGLNQVLKKTKFKKIMIRYLLINIDFQKKSLKQLAVTTPRAVFTD